MDCGVYLGDCNRVSFCSVYLGGLDLTQHSRELGVASANTEECFLPAMDNGAPGLHGAVLAKGAVLPVQGEPDCRISNIHRL